MALGVVLAPYGKIPGSWPTTIVGAKANRHVRFGPEDPQHFTRGEAGYYYDTPLGDATEYGTMVGTGARRPGLIKRFLMRQQLRGLGRAAGLGILPTDAELATRYGYTPTYSGWIPTADGQAIHPSWVVPDGRRWAGAWSAYSMPVSNLSGIRDGDPSVAVPGETAASATDVVRVLQAHNDRVFALTLVSTVAVATSALLTFFRTIKLIREDKRA